MKVLFSHTICVDFSFVIRYTFYVTSPPPLPLHATCSMLHILLRIRDDLLHLLISFQRPHQFIQFLKVCIFKRPLCSPPPPPPPPPGGGGGGGGRGGCCFSSQTPTPPHPDLQDSHYAP